MTSSPKSRAASVVVGTQTLTIQYIHQSRCQCVCRFETYQCAREARKLSLSEVGVERKPVWRASAGMEQEVEDPKNQACS